MLFNPSWTPAETKPADPFSLPALIAWLETMPANGTYCYIDNGRCLIARYLTVLGHKRVRISPWTYDSDKSHGDLPEGWDHIACGDPAKADTGAEWKFGKALTRARKALSDQQSRGVADTSREAV